MPSIKFVFFAPIFHPIWPPWPLDWLKHFSTASLQLLNGFLVHLSQRLKCTIVIMRCPSSVVRRLSSVRPSLTFHIFDFFSETTGQISTKLDRKQVLNVLYQVCIFHADRKSKMAALASDWLKHFSTFSPQLLNGFWRNLTRSKSSSPSIRFVFFVPTGNPRWPPWPLIGWNIFRLFHRNRWMDFDENWQEASSQRPLPSLCFSCRLVIQDGRPGLWLAETFFDFFSVVPIGNPRWLPWPLIGWNIFRLLLCNRWMDFDETWQEASPHRPLSDFCFLCRSEIQDGRPGLWLAETFFDFFSATAEWILTKLDRKQVLIALYQICVFYANRKSKMATLASDWLKHFSTSSPQPLNGFWRNLTGSKSPTPSVKFVFFVPIGNPRWPPWPLIGWNIFQLLHRNRWMDFYETW